MKKGLKIGTLLLTGNLALFTLTGCAIDRKEINTTKINTGGKYKIDYDNASTRYDEYIERTFEEGQHVISIKSACTFEYDKNFVFNAPEGYEVLSANYNENATSNTGYAYGYMFIVFVNIEPVKVKGYYNEETNTYQFTNFGTVVEKEKQKTLTD